MTSPPSWIGRPSGMSACSMRPRPQTGHGPLEPRPHQVNRGPACGEVARGGSGRRDPAPDDDDRQLLLMGPPIGREIRVHPRRPLRRRRNRRNGSQHTSGEPTVAGVELAPLALATRERSRRARPTGLRRAARDAHRRRAGEKCRPYAPDSSYTPVDRDRPSAKTVSSCTTTGSGSSSSRCRRDDASGRRGGQKSARSALRAR